MGNLNLLDLIRNRRSVRKYTDKPVGKKDILTCLEAARLAPSACNSQPWKFIVVDNKDLKDKLCDAAFSSVYSGNKFVKTAPAIIAVVQEPTKLVAKIGSFFKDTKFRLIDIGISCEHFILQAHELGLGTCWIGWFNEKGVKELLKVPEDKRVHILISLGYAGYAQEQIIKDKTRKDLSEISSFNQYDT